MLSGDDTFTNSPSQSQLYSYIAPNADAVWNDQGALWAFQTNGPKQKYEDFVPGDATSVTGQFIPVPRLIATGRNPDGSDLMAGDVPASLGGPYPLPPNDGPLAARPERRRHRRAAVGPRLLVELPENHVFGFVRVEDIAYDKRPGMSNVAYVVDSGRGTAPVSLLRRAARADFGRLSTNGRVWKMVLDPDDPKKVTSLSILIEGDDMPVKTADRDPSARQHRVDRQRPVHHRGPGFEPAVPGRLDRSGRDDGPPLAVHRRDR